MAQPVTGFAGLPSPVATGSSRQFSGSWRERRRVSSAGGTGPRSARPCLSSDPAGASGPPRGAQNYPAAWRRAHLYGPFTTYDHLAPLLGPLTPHTTTPADE